MRVLLAAVVVTVGVGFLGAVSASAAPANGAAIAQANQDASQVVQTAGRMWARLAPRPAGRMPPQLSAASRKQHDYWATILG